MNVLNLLQMTVEMMLEYSMHTIAFPESIAIIIRCQRIVAGPFDLSGPFEFSGSQPV